MPRIACLDLDAADEFVTFARLFNVALLLSQARLLGFGDGGKTTCTDAGCDGTTHGALALHASWRSEVVCDEAEREVPRAARQVLHWHGTAPTANRSARWATRLALRICSAAM